MAIAINIKFNPVLDGGTYDFKSEVLRLNFKKSFQQRSYMGIPAKIFHELQNAPSPANYFATAIKGRYTVIEVKDIKTGRIL